MFIFSRSIFYSLADFNLPSYNVRERINGPKLVRFLDKSVLFNSLLNIVVQRAIAVQRATIQLYSFLRHDGYTKQYLIREFSKICELQLIVLNIFFHIIDEGLSYSLITLEAFYKLRNLASFLTLSKIFRIEDYNLHRSLNSKLNNKLVRHLGYIARRQRTGLEFARILFKVLEVIRLTKLGLPF